ncbi:hypothetical protein QA861_01510 [Streptomyces sp. B21-083]
MNRHGEFTHFTGIHVYFCEPASPWQRGSNENTNALLRQYFPRAPTCWNTPANLLARLVVTLERSPCCDDDWNPPRLLVVAVLHPQTKGLPVCGAGKGRWQFRGAIALGRV